MQNNTLFQQVLADRRLGKVDVAIIHFLLGRGNSDLKQQEIASLVGYSRPVVNVSIGKLKLLGYITTRKMKDTKCKKITLKGGQNV